MTKTALICKCNNHFDCDIINLSKDIFIIRNDLIKPVNNEYWNKVILYKAGLIPEFKELDITHKEIEPNNTLFICPNCNIALNYRDLKKHLYI